MKQKYIKKINAKVQRGRQQNNSKKWRSKRVNMRKKNHRKNWPRQNTTHKYIHVLKLVWRVWRCVAWRHRTTLINCEVGTIFFIIFIPLFIWVFGGCFFILVWSSLNRSLLLLGYPEWSCILHNVLCDILACCCCCLHRCHHSCHHSCHQHIYVYIHVLCITHNLSSHDVS